MEGTLGRGTGRYKCIVRIGRRHPHRVADREQRSDCERRVNLMGGSDFTPRGCRYQVKAMRNRAERCLISSKPSAPSRQPAAPPSRVLVLEMQRVDDPSARHSPLAGWQSETNSFVSGGEASRVPRPSRIAASLRDRHESVHHRTGRHNTTLACDLSRLIDGA
jgi:hypothetical protein